MSLRTNLKLVALFVLMIIVCQGDTSDYWEVPDTINCSSLGEISQLQLLASGWTKSVYKGKMDGKDIAIKTINLDGQDIESCLNRPDNPSLTWCYRRTTAKLLRELILLQQLDHPDVIKVYGSCVPKNSFGPVVIATELGEPLDSIALMQLSWEEKLKIVMGMASLLHHLAHSPLGSLAAPDLKRQQFVLVKGRLKLADADDIVITEPTCSSHSDCTISHESEKDTDVYGVYCISGVCRGYNEKANILTAGKDLVEDILQDNVPESLESQVMNLLSAYNGINKWDTGKILEETEALVRLSA